MTHHFLLHGSLWPTNLEKNLKPCILGVFQTCLFSLLQDKLGDVVYIQLPEVGDSLEAGGE